MRMGTQGGGRIVPAGAVLAALVLASCVTHRQEYQPVRIPKLKQETLKFQGSTEKFVGVLRGASASNITVGHGMCADGGIIDVVMADYLKHVYIFMDGKFRMRAKIPFDAGKAPVHPTVKVVRAGDASAVVLVADVMRIKGKEAGLLVTFDREGGRAVVPLPLHGLLRKHDGMRDPYIGGTDMNQGILLTARNADGNPWSKVYQLKLVGKKIEVKTMSYQMAWQCSCFGDWLDGKDGRMLFGEVIE
jgi:hypothetical protein